MTNHSEIKRISIGLLSAGIAVVGVIACTFTTSESAQAQSRIPQYGRNSIRAGSHLYPSYGLTSRNRCFNFVMKNDGNLVVYNNNTRTEIWNAGISDNPNISKTTLKRNGKLVVSTSNNAEVWSSGKVNNDAPYLILQDDGNLVIYSNRRAVVWATDRFDPSYLKKNCKV
jgi:exopolysaccharide biosynthesis protein